MAFDLNKLDKLSFCVNPFTANWKAYKNTADTLATMAASGYFVDPMLKVGDVIYILGSNGSDLRRVVSIAPIVTTTILPGAQGNFQFTGTYWVDGNRTDTYTQEGSEQFPFKTIQAAINAASVAVYPTIVIKIAPGDYVENVVLENANLRKVSLIGSTQWDTRIVPASGNSLQSKVNNSNLTDIVIQNLLISKPVDFAGTGSFLSNLSINSSKFGYDFNCSTVNGNIYAHETTFASTVTLTGTNSNLTQNIFTGVINVFGSNQMLLINNRISGNLLINDNIQAVLKENVMSGAVNIGIVSETLATTTAWCYNNQFSGTVTVNTTGHFSNNYFSGPQSLDVEYASSGTYGTANCHSDYFTTPVYVGIRGILNLRDCSSSSTITKDSGGLINVIEPLSSCTDGVVAHVGGGQSNATLIKEKFVVISTVATSGDSCVLPHARVGDWMMIRNNGANPADIFPPSGEYMNGFINTAVSMTNATSAVIYAKTEGHWYAALFA